MKPIRYGIIGCGSMGREHIENLKALGGVRVTALADTHRPSLDAALALLPDHPPTVFATPEALLQSDLCDAVVIATPNFTHAGILRQALATPMHILIEKPLVTRIEDGLDLVRAAEGRQALVWVAQEYRYMPPVAELIRMAHEGAPEMETGPEGPVMESQAAHRPLGSEQAAFRCARKWRQCPGRRRCTWSPAHNGPGCVATRTALSP